MRRFEFAWWMLLALGAPTAASAAAPAPGDRYEVQSTAKAESESSNGNSGSSFDRSRVAIRVIAVGPEGTELEYDLPFDTLAADRAKEWQYPARIFRPADGSAAQLRNPAELEARLDPWLKLAKWDRRVCGRWIFTWNAFKIECDPQTVLGVVAAFELQPPELRAGAIYRHPATAAPGVLRQIKRADGKDLYKTSMAIDPEQVRSELAESDVVVGQIVGKPKTIEVARAERAKMQISGTMTFTFEADADGQVVQRTISTRLELIDAAGVREVRTNTVTLERIPLSPVKS